MELYLKDSAATEALGKCLGRCASGGDVFCLTGDLGAGKTLLSRGIAGAMGVSGEDVNSPTFAIMNIYHGRMEIRHFDLYRLQRAEELEDIGFDEYVGGDGLTLIEWADLFPEQLPEEYLLVKLLREGEGRRAIFQAHGQRYEDLLQEVKRNADFSD